SPTKSSTETIWWFCPDEENDPNPERSFAMTATADATIDSHQHSPAVLAHEADRASSMQLRLADRITAFAGSMTFVYIHAVIFGIWMVFIESDPWPKLTLIVSLEAIFLSTFVMIGQNRQADFAARKADHDFHQEETELHHNTELTEAIHELAKAIHARL